MLDLSVLLWSAGVSAVVTIGQVGLEYVVAQKQLPSQIDVSYPDPDMDFGDYGCTARIQAPGIETRPIEIHCDYCRTRAIPNDTNCRNCGAPL